MLLLRLLIFCNLKYTLQYYYFPFKHELFIAICFSTKSINFCSLVITRVTFYFYFYETSKYFKFILKLILHEKPRLILSIYLNLNLKRLTQHGQLSNKTLIVWRKKTFHYWNFINQQAGTKQNLYTNICIHYTA